MKKKNRKFVIVTLAVIIILIAVLAIVVVNKNDGSKVTPNNVTKGETVKVTGKLLEYINNIGNKYHIKYTGDFKNSDGKLINATVNYYKSGKDFLIKSDELNVDVICKNNEIYSIADKYKLMVKMSEISKEIKQLNLVSDIGQMYVEEKQDNVNSIDYIVEKYKLDNVEYSYYFNGKNLEYIKIIDENNEKQISVVLEKNVSEEIFKIPDNYEIAIA